VAGRTTEGLHQRERLVNGGQLQPPPHIAAHERRVLGGGTLNKGGDHILGSGRATGQRQGSNRCKRNAPVHCWDFDLIGL
jgi:hypothetical protein